ncbi:MAG: CD225/dispanin family protein, partial [Bacteroidota bacterium]
GMADWVPAAQTDLIASAGPPPVRSQQAAGWDPEPEQTFAGPVDNHLVKAILVTIFCCLPLGIVSIVYAAQVNGHVQAGRRAEALEASANASKWANWGLIAGLVIGVLYILYFVVIIGFAGMGALDSY